jgi:hypothetical protein
LLSWKKNLTLYNHPPPNRRKYAAVLSPRLVSTFGALAAENINYLILTTMNSLHNPTKASLISGTMKFHEKAARAFGKLKKTECEKRANQAAQRLRNVLNAIEK